MAPGRSNAISGNQLRNSSSISPSIPGPSVPFQTTGAVPPPVPPRQPTQSYLGYNNYRPYNSSYGFETYGNYGYGSGYRNYGGYGSFGSYNPYSSSYGHSGDAENRFQQYAEESTRSTFRVVETVLHTFSSITMLLESTYFALTNSFRAILSVADNIGRLRSTLGQLLSTFALIRFMKWVYRRILFMLGLQTQNAVTEDLWQQSISQLAGGERTTTTTTAVTTNERLSPWMNVLLLGVFVAIPYLIHKISNSIKQNQVKVNDPNEWVKCEDAVCVATAMYDFMAVSNEELNLRAGQKIWLAPRSLQSKSIPGWWIATDNKNVGLVPANYVTIVGQLKRKLEPESNGNVTSMVIPSSTQNATVSDEQINTPDPGITQQSTDPLFSENIKGEL